jgi:uncharacterized protein YwqG
VSLFFVPNDEAPLISMDDEKMHSKHLDQARDPAIWFRRHPGQGSMGKLGGLPTLPFGTDWPRHLESGEPLHFLAQIDLSRLPPTPLLGARKPSPLPKAGLLFFFADMVEEMLWSGHGGPFANTRVIYSERAGPERAPPEDTPDLGHALGQRGHDYAGGPGRASFSQGSIEPYVIETFAGVDPFPDESDSYAAAAQAALVASIERATGATLPVLNGAGSAEVLKSAQALEYVRVEHFHDGTVHRALECPRHQMLGVGKNLQGTAEEHYAEGLVLLLQIDSDKAVDSDFVFCDMGAAQFWIKPDDLAVGRFDRAWGTTEGA